MAIGNLNPGGQGTFALSVLDNGQASSAVVVGVPTWSTDDPNAVVTPSADGLSATVDIPASDTVTSITVKADGQVTDPQTGQPSAATGSITVPVTPGTGGRFSFKIDQTA